MKTINTRNRNASPRDTERGGQRGLFKCLTGCGELHPDVMNFPLLKVFEQKLTIASQ